MNARVGQFGAGYRALRRDPARDGARIAGLVIRAAVVLMLVGGAVGIVLVLAAVR